MIKNVLSDIGGIGIYGIISVCLFFVVFTGMLIWAFRLKRADAEAMSVLPLHDGEKSIAPKGTTSHE
jgi:cbb3-type cytochrome oxidase subunit 3